MAGSKLKPANACLTTVELANLGVDEITGPGSRGLRKGSFPTLDGLDRLTARQSL